MGTASLGGAGVDLGNLRVRPVGAHPRLDAVEFGHGRGDQAARLGLALVPDLHVHARAHLVGLLAEPFRAGRVAR